MNHVEEKINELKKQTDFYIQEIKQKVEKIMVPDQVSVISYFTASFNISYILDDESICLGTYHIRNLGNQPITNPSILIKLPENSPFSFSGRYVNEHFATELKATGSWERFNDQSSKDEFWLKPVGKTAIEPNETLSFSNFQIKWAHNLSYSGSIMGVTYCDQFKEGITVLNPINLNGISPAQEDIYE
ncbi:hypothetical protein [Rummeliibacillus sp. TYF-LIM-RU47]|uniref:hypothetical protein n=1 Tax=unclassified Rummeliibacillus TaxID=2622809 RepID=UPI00123A50C2|nr:hypothetical protein [Rummeliibacillus sp. TYF-LIM-RU47]